MAKSKERYYGTGRRKTSVARVYLTQGKGEIVINKIPVHNNDNILMKVPLSIENKSQDTCSAFTIINVTKKLVRYRNKWRRRRISSENLSSSPLMKANDSKGVITIGTMVEKTV